MRRTASLLGAVAAAVIVGAWWNRTPAPSPSPAPVAPSASAVTATMTPSPSQMASPVDAAPTEAPVTGRPGTAADPIRVLRERLDRRERWHRIKTDDADARASLVAAARAGDDEAQMELSARLSVCPKPRAGDPAVSPAFSTPPPAPRAEDAFVALCAKWTEQTGTDDRDPQVWRDRAAAAGNGIALVARAGDDALATGVRREALQKAWATRDPGVADFLFALASSDRDYRAEQRANGSPGFFFGSYLVQCRLGADCGRDGALFQRWCRRGGVACASAPSLEALFEQRLSPAQYGIARDQAAAFAQAFNSRPEDAPEGRSLLRTIDKSTAPAADDDR